jgi:phosphohistidine phosphatase SixA
MLFRTTHQAITHGKAVAHMLPRLLLLRHATPVPEEVDASKPLSNEGLAEAEFAAHGLAAFLDLKGKFSPRAKGQPVAVKIVHSDKSRAVQTAEALATVLQAAGCTVEKAESTDLAPNADPALAQALITAALSPPPDEGYCGCADLFDDELVAEADAALPAVSPSPPSVIVIVGHLPHLQKLATALGLTASTELFTPAGGLLLVLEKPGERSWEIVATVAHKVSWWMEAPPPPIGIAPNV